MLIVYPPAIAGGTDCVQYARWTTAILDHRKTQMIVFSSATVRGPEPDDVITSRLDPGERRRHRAVGVSRIVDQNQAARTNQLGRKLKLRPHEFGFMHRIQQHCLINFTS